MRRPLEGVRPISFFNPFLALLVVGRLAACWKEKALEIFLSCDSEEIFMGYFKGYVKQAFLGFVSGKHEQVPKEYVLNHAVCSFCETVRWWMNGHGQYTPEEMTEFFLQVLG